MQLVIPALLQTNALLDNLGEPRLPALDLMLTRGRLEHSAPASLDEWLCQKFDISQQRDTPIAAICLAMDGTDPGQEYWLRADPVHIRIARDQLILNEITDLTGEEASQLARTLAEHFGDDFSPVILKSGAWVMSATHHANMATTPLSRAIGQHIDPLLPRGTDAMHWKKLLNEIQMLLFDHPVNQAREAKGLPTANSVWLWGGGKLPTKPDHASPHVLMTKHTLAQTLAKFAQATLHPMQAAWTPELMANLLIFDAPQAALQRGDLTAWLDAMKALEQHWLKPLLDNQPRFTLYDPTQGTCLHWKSSDRWKLWRRPQKPQRQTFGFATTNTDASAVSNVDEFGNRF